MSSGGSSAEFPASQSAQGVSPSSAGTSHAMTVCTFDWEAAASALSAVFASANSTRASESLRM
jgi:hypothetical protein